MPPQSGRERWVCPECSRAFSIAAGRKLDRCPDCQQAPDKASSVTADCWYLQLKFEPEPRGPLTLREVQRLFRNGTLATDDLARRGGRGDSIEVSEYPEICSVPPPSSIPVFTTQTAATHGILIREYFPVVSARRVYGINIVAEFLNRGSDWIGGRVPRYEQANENIEKELMDELRQLAWTAGANAIVDFRMQFGEFSAKDIFMLWGVAHGTPITIE